MYWMIHHGLKAYGFNELAEKVMHDSLELIEQYGFYEYFDARKAHPEVTHNGYGGNNFSWSAALYIDFMTNAD